MKRLCFDPFLTEVGDKRAGKGYSLPEYTSYLSGYSSNMGPQRKAWGEQYGLRYAILSRGIDMEVNSGDWNMLWLYLGSHQHHITGIPLIYSATNGTYSRGDMIVTNRGHEGP